MLAILAIGTTTYIINNKKKNIKYKPAQNFNLQDFLGRWYEIARIENSIQKNQINVTHRFNVSNKDKFLNITIRVFNTKKNNNVGLFSAIF